MSDLVLSSLAECEAVIERNLGAFFETGHALMAIRDDELYREAGFDGFVEYLESKPWGIAQRTAYQYIDAHAVCAIAQTSMPEAQARELAPLLKKSTPEVVRQVYAEVLDEAGEPEKVTAAKIREKVRAILPRKGRKKNPDAEGAAEYLADVHADDALRNLRTQAVSWFESGAYIASLIEEGEQLVPKSDSDREGLLTDLKSMERVVKQLKEMI